MTMKCVLSDWELDEMAMLWRRGWSCKKLAAWYGVSDRTIQRNLRRMQDGGDARGKIRNAVAGQQEPHR